MYVPCFPADTQVWDHQSLDRQNCWSSFSILQQLISLLLWTCHIQQMQPSLHWGTVSAHITTVIHPCYTNPHMHTHAHTQYACYRLTALCSSLAKASSKVYNHLFKHRCQLYSTKYLVILTSQLCTDCLDTTQPWYEPLHWQLAIRHCQGIELLYIYSL